MANNMTREQIIKESRNMDPEELIQKLAEEQMNFIEQLPTADPKKCWTLDDFDKATKTHPLFMTKAPDPSEELPPLLEALQSFKYDPNENTPKELAKSYKDDGNENFKNKKYRFAVESYTEGLKANCTDQELLVQLYSNRAAAHYHIGNYEKSLKDAAAAKSIKSNHVKALERGALCCFHLNNLTDCIEWCHEGLTLFPENKQLKELQLKATEKKKANDRDRRRALAKKSQYQKELEAARKVIAERKIQLGNENLVLDSTDSLCPGAVTGKVHLDKDNKLIWPVMIMYPEYGTSDYIQEFNEDSTFMDHFNIMFQKDDPPGWDKEKKYIAENLQVYFMNKQNAYVIPVIKTDTLGNALLHKRYKVFDGTPGFLVTVKDSPFDKDFRNKYIVVK